MTRQANIFVSEQLVQDVIMAGCSLKVQRPLGRKGDIDYSSRARLAERYGKVPQGKRLQVKPVPSWMTLTQNSATYSAA